jgi:hypothetical protein
MTRLIANLLFAAGIGLATLLNAFQVPLPLVFAATLSTALIAVLANCMWFRTAGFAGLPGLWFVSAQLLGQNNPGASLTLIASGFCIAGIVLFLIADFASQTKGETIRTHEST